MAHIPTMSADGGSTLPVDDNVQPQLTLADNDTTFSEFLEGFINASGEIIGLITPLAAAGIGIVGGFIVGTGVSIATSVVTMIADIAISTVLEITIDVVEGSLSMIIDVGADIATFAIDSGVSLASDAIDGVIGFGQGIPNEISKTLNGDNMADIFQLIKSGADALSLDAFDFDKKGGNSLLRGIGEDSGLQGRGVPGQNGFNFQGGGGGSKGTGNTTVTGPNGKKYVLIKLSTLQKMQRQIRSRKRSRNRLPQYAIDAIQDAKIDAAVRRR